VDGDASDTLTDIFAPTVVAVDGYEFTREYSTDFSIQANDEEPVPITINLIVQEPMDALNRILMVEFRLEDEEQTLLARHTYQMTYKEGDDYFETDLVSLDVSDFVLDSVEFLELYYDDETNQVNCKYGIRQGITLTTGYNYYLDFTPDK
jgi:hypothetical protein